ncbi:PREDICTED: catenin alpha-like isoform X2 [Nicrophorus vespilloides]|uniref:Catenin alpha-like isoform X2 n=1 Tax=Nicrophorus vespilloides TaxID=110193 RepID=A0ABM1NJU4_NICVS|nr:PREDICTED: catenin alpha-like isoform X2 [Nicrophorus vespilloides]
MADHFGLKWDPKNLEIRTMSVEKTLEPLVLQVTTLVNTKGPSKKKKGKSKRANALVSTVEKATENFIQKGEQIAYENKDITQEMLSAVDEVRKTGTAMSIAAREFSEDPCSSLKRGNMVRAARNLLSAVTRLLILADMVDVHLLLKSLRVVEDDLQKLRDASSQGELLDNIKAFGHNANELMNQAAKRQQELKDPQLRDDLAAARAVLKKHSTMLLTASKVYVRHPELAAAKANRDYVLKQVCEAVNTISDVAQGRTPQPTQSPYDGPGELAAALDEFDEHMEMEPLAYNEVHTRPSLEERLESIISGAALMADSSCTRDERRERIVAECNAVRQALQDLLSEYMSNQMQVLRGGARIGNKEQSDGLGHAIDHMGKKTRDLRRQLRKAVVDHVSDSFLETNVPLLVLIKAAQNGNEKEVDEYAVVFTEHSNKLVEVANLVCSMSNNEDGVKMVRYAAAQIDNLCPEVINAAHILAARHRSKVAQENMDAFKQAWENQVRILTEAVDDITTIDDFLAVSENHILEDVNKCVLALQECDGDTLERTAGGIRGRSSRVCNVVTAEMDNYEPCVYTKRVLEAVKVLNDQVMPKFGQRVSVGVAALSSNPPKEVDENDFIDAARLVYDGVREIRRAVLMNRADEDLDPEDVVVDENYTLETRSKSSAHTGEHGVDEYPDISGITTAREAMGKMPEEDKQKILQQVEYFRSEKLKFDREVAKWDDTGNDIIVLAKHMCMIMMEMTDFTRGRGPLKTTMDVINAAKKISEAGTKLDKLTRQIAEQCPESSTKKDLLAYLQRIALYCHQMNITSKVKADVQNISGELIVSGLDSATSLIQAAKNLMNAVVLTVKASYVASTKYPRQTAVASPIVVWKMKAPEKKPLVRPERPEEVRAKVRKGSQKKVQNPIHALSEFQSPAESV